MIYVIGVGCTAFGLVMGGMLAAAGRADCERECAFWRERTRQLEQELSVLRQARAARLQRSDAVWAKLQERLDKSAGEER